MLLYSMQPAQQSTQKHNQLQRMHTCDHVSQTCELAYVTGHAYIKFTIRRLIKETLHVGNTVFKLSTEYLLNHLGLPCSPSCATVMPWFPSSCQMWVPGGSGCTGRSSCPTCTGIHVCHLAVV